MVLMPAPRECPVTISFFGRLIRSEKRSNKFLQERNSFKDVVVKSRVHPRLATKKTSTTRTEPAGLALRQIFLELPFRRCSSKISHPVQCRRCATERHDNNIVIVRNESLSINW